MILKKGLSLKGNSQWTLVNWSTGLLQVKKSKEAWCEIKKQLRNKEATVYKPVFIKHPNHESTCLWVEMTPIVVQ